MSATLVVLKGRPSWYVTFDLRDEADICGHDGVLCRHPIYSDRPIPAIGEQSWDIQT